MYLQTTDSNRSQWWDMYVDEREFWDDLPSIIEALLRRWLVLLHIFEKPVADMEKTKCTQVWSPDGFAFEK